jgi:hypothetical protein
MSKKSGCPIEAAMKDFKINPDNTKGFAAVLTPKKAPRLGDDPVFQKFESEAKSNLEANHKK